mmetsp:Transcript_22866/g.58151  ORF Transcript_22866/g.58151 Transcript_22866/m.58151 type:complete len:301 (+) Transcript_22866:29-931(+)
MAEDEEASTTHLVPSLPQELVRIISLAVDTAMQLSAIEQVCFEWRAGVDDSAWRTVTLRRFPSVAKLVDMLAISKPCYRAIFRDQQLAMHKVTPTRPVNERLRQFAFTVDLVVGSEELSWTGFLQTSPCAQVVIDCVGCKLWDAAKPPLWATALLEAHNEDTNASGSARPKYKEQCRLLSQNLRMTLSVSKATLSGTRTLCLATALAPDVNSFEAGSFSFGYVGEFFDALPQLSFASLECLRVFAGHEEIGQDLDGPQIRPWLDTRSGILDGIFCTAGGGPDAFVLPERVADYFERFAPW